MQRATWEWVPPAGDPVTLPVRDPVSGRGHPPVQLATDQIVGQPGATVRHVRHAVRVLDLPVLLAADDRLAFRDLLHAYAQALDPTRGEGRLRVTEPGRAARELRCRYTGGLELNENDPEWQLAVLTFRGHDPLWQDAAATVRTIGVDDVAFLSPDAATPWYPVQVIAADALGNFEVDNDSDTAVWPVWVVQGPGAGLLSLANDTSGQVIELADVALQAGEQIVIDTRPGAKTAVGPDGTSLWPDLSDASELWPLERGPQRVTVLLEGAAPGESSVRLEYRRRWLTA